MNNDNKICLSEDDISEIEDEDEEEDNNSDELKDENLENNDSGISKLIIAN